MSLPTLVVPRNGNGDPPPTRGFFTLPGSLSPVSQGPHSVSPRSRMLYLSKVHSLSHVMSFSDPFLEWTPGECSYSSTRRLLAPTSAAFVHRHAYIPRIRPSWLARSLSRLWLSAPCPDVVLGLSTVATRTHTSSTNAIAHATTVRVGS